MKLPLGAAAGLAAGLVGAAVWAALGYYANVEIGWLALGIGALVGIATVAGASVASDDEPAGPLLGVVASVITVLSICGGKYAMVEIQLQQAVSEVVAESSPLTDENLVSWIADTIGEETHGESWYDQYEWPESDEEGPDSQAEYPADLWKEAQAKWDAMTPSEQTDYREEITQQVQANKELFASLMLSEARFDAFKSTFGFLDILFFFFGVATAWGIANGGGDD